MPTVPAAVGPSADLRPLADGRAAPTATPEQYGAGSGRALARTGQALSGTADALGNHALRLQEHEDETTVRQAFLTFNTQTNGYANDPERGVYNRKGLAAKGATQEALGKLDEFEKEAGKGLRTPRQQRLFALRVGELKEGHLNSFSQHEGSELRQAENDTAKAVLTTAIEGGASAFRSEALRGEYMAQGDYELQRLGQLNGWSQEQFDAERAKYQTLFHKGVIERTLVNDPSGAKAYYEKYQGQISGGTRTEIEASLKDGVTREAARGETERILGAGGGLAEQLSKARAIPDATLSDEVVRRVKERFTEQEALLAKVERDAKDAAWQLVMSKGTMDAVPPHIMSKLDGYTVNAMRGFIEDRGNPITDQAVLYKLSQMTTNDSQAFAGLDLNEYRTKLSRSDFNTVAGWQRSVDASLKGDAAKATEVKRIATVQQQIDAAMNKLGMPGGEDGYVKRGTFAQAARDAITVETNQVGRDLTVMEVDAVLARMAIKGEVRGAWNDREGVPLGEVMGTEDEANFVVPYDDLTPQQREQAAEALTAKKLPVTPEAIERLHSWFIRNGG